MSSDTSVPQAYSQLLINARAVVTALEQIDPDDITRDTWEHELDDYLDALNTFEQTQNDIFAAIYGESSGKGRIREFFKDHIGDAVRSERVSRVSGIKQYGRRIRELRNEEGFIIDSTRTRTELGQNDYFMVGIEDVTTRTRISAQARYEQLQRQSSCELCGRDKNHPDVPHMEVDHIIEYVNADPDMVNNPENLQTLCVPCHTGKTASSGVTNPSPN